MRLYRFEGASAFDPRRQYARLYSLSGNLDRLYVSGLTSQSIDERMLIEVSLRLTQCPELSLWYGLASAEVSSILMRCGDLSTDQTPEYMTGRDLGGNDKKLQAIYTI